MLASTKSRIALVASLLAAAPAMADVPAGVQAGTSGGVHGEVQIAKADYVTPQRQIGHQIGSGEPIYMGDQISTGAGGGLQVMLLDQTVMTLGQNAKMTIDEMVYDPKSGTGKLNFNVTQGAFRFVSGQIAKANPENVNIKTPMATIGIRGTLVGGSVDSGNTLVALLGPGDQTNTSARHGAIEVTTPSGTVSITRTGYSTVITPGAPPSPPAPVTAEQLQRFGQAGAGSSGTAASTAANGGAQNSGGGSSSSNTTTSTTTNSGTSANSVSGEGLANGGVISNVVTTFVSNVQQQNKIVSDNAVTGDQKKVADSSSSSSDTTTLTLSEKIGSTLSITSGYGLITASISTDCYPSVCTTANVTSDPTSGSATLTDSTHTTFSLPNIGYDTNSYTILSDTADLSYVSESSGITLLQGTGNTYGHNISVYDYKDNAGLKYMTFGRYEASLGYDYGVGVFVYGVQTPVASMPSSGSATYSGTTTGYVSSDLANTSYAYNGIATLTANFSSKTISGSLTNLTTTSSTGIGTVSGTSIGSISLGSASISGNSYSGSASNSTTSGLLSGVTLSGTYSGNFYGGGASETGGGYSLSGSQSGNTYTLIGTYGAKK